MTEKISQLVQTRYETWCNDPFFDEKTRQELLAISNDHQEINERFYKFLEVGTGGLRGILGAGTNRINIYTVSHITEGLARMLLKQEDFKKEAGVVISYDSRNMSKEFAKQTALVLAAHGIRAYVFKNLQATPILSFAVRYYKAAAGVMITASHNPAKYNGYKMYGSDGGQMPPKLADEVLASMAEIKDLRELKWATEEEALRSGNLQYIGEEVCAAYQDLLISMQINKEALKLAEDIKFVYTPLHGTGAEPIMRIFKTLNYKGAEILKEQAMPDGNFPTVKYPNPEEKEALQMAIDRAKEIGAELVIATDPDADRMGVALKNDEGEFEVLTGNQIGLLLLEYILSAKQETNCLEKDSFVATTIVSSRLVQKIANFYDIKFFEVLTGFKYIGELIKDYHDTGKLKFQFGFEESYGYLANPAVRDKDAVSACMLFAEMLCSAKLKNESLFTRLEKLYQKYGYGLERTVSITLEGQEGILKIQNALNKLRELDNLTLDHTVISAKSDYLNSIREDYNHNQKQVSKLLLPKSNVLLYELEGMDWVCVRPSGTEPKLKIYAGSYARERSVCEAKLAKHASNFESLIKSLID